MAFKREILYFQYGFQKAATISFYCMITAFSILLQLHGILFILVLLILDFTYLVVLVVAILKSNLERIQKIRMRFKEKSIPPCRAGPPAHLHMTNFHLT